MSIAPSLRFALAAAIAFATLSAPAFADERDWGDIDVIADGEMNDLRGGFEIPGTTINVNFGAVVTTVMNGIPVLTTNVTWTDAGAVVDRTMANVGESLSEMSPEAIEALGLNGLQGAGGLVIEDEAGVTAIVHNITQSSIQNIIVNNATGRDLAQDIDVTLTLPGFEYVQQQIATERFGMRIGEDLSNVMIGLE